MPVGRDLVEGNPNVFLTSLTIGLPLLTLLFPLTRLSTGATTLLYLYFRYEHFFNSALVRRTPPSPEAHLPSHEDWIANGGLKRILPLTSAADSDCCIICYEPPTDPTQIAQCGHVFCAECVGAWHAKGNRSCPQCTIVLWRAGPVNYSRLEKVVKFTAAAGLVAAPMTVFALYCCFAYYIYDNETGFGIFQALPLLSFTALSFLALVFVWQGLVFMLEQRRLQGIKWWGADLEPDAEQAWRMAMTAMALFASCWLLLVSGTCEAYLGTFAPVLERLQAVIDTRGWQRRS